MDIKLIQQQLREFAAERDWEQFHSPKNLASALSVEAAELLEHFQWTDSGASYALSDEKGARKPAKTQSSKSQESHPPLEQMSIPHCFVR